MSMTYFFTQHSCCARKHSLKLSTRTRLTLLAASSFSRPPCSLWYRMIGFGAVSKVFVELVPLYFALSMGYASVKWTNLFTPEKCDGVSCFVAYFAMPFMILGFSLRTNPSQMNYTVILADVISKNIIIIIVVVVVLIIGTYASSNDRKGVLITNVGRCITGFSLSTLTSSLVVGVPMARAMYGEWAEKIVTDLSIMQADVWLPLLLFSLEARKAAIGIEEEVGTESVVIDETLPESSLAHVDIETSNNNNDNGVTEVAGEEEQVVPIGWRSYVWRLLKTVANKLKSNPNIYASFGGMAWAFFADRLQIKVPSILDYSVLIMSKCGTGMAMFSLGQFMAQQENLLVCGPVLAMLGIVLKFILGPVCMAIACIAVGLRGNTLRLAILQAAVPQSITSFIFAKEYGLHTDTLSTAVALGTILFLPVLIVFNVILGSAVAICPSPAPAPYLQ